MKFPHIYPDPESRRLRKQLSQDCGLPSENIIVGCGADELLDLILRVVLEPGDRIINTPPTFGMYAFDCAINAGQVVEVPRGAAPGFKIDVPAIINAVQEYKPKLIFLTSPNNPDGSVIDSKDIDELLKLPVLVCLDEAYIEFCESQESRMKAVLDHENLIVLRTFSKRAALAGIRVGYGALPLWLMNYMWRVKQPYNVSAVAEEAACAALNSPEYLKLVRDLIVKERERLFSKLNSFTFLTPYPSNSNFILTNVEGDAADLKQYLGSKGVVVRYYSTPQQLASCIRISVGKPEQTDKLVSVLEMYRCERNIA